MRHEAAAAHQDLPSPHTAHRQAHIRSHRQPALVALHTTTYHTHSLERERAVHYAPRHTPKLSRQLTAYYLLQTADCFTAYCLLRTVVLLTAYCLLLTTYYLLLTPYYLLRATCRKKAYYLLQTAYCSLVACERALSVRYDDGGGPRHRRLRVLW